MQHTADDLSWLYEALCLDIQASFYYCRDFMSNVKRVAKKIQGGLPIVGLLSRLSAPGGGFDEIVSGL